MADVTLVGPRTAELAEMLDETGHLLRQVGEKGWAEWLRRDVAALRRNDIWGVEHFLSAFGGMGNLDDLNVCPENGHDVEATSVALINDEIRERLQRCVELASVLERNIDVAG